MKLHDRVVAGFIVIFLVSIVIVLPKLVRTGDIICISQFGPCNDSISNKLEKVRGLPIGSARKQISEVLTQEVLVKDFSIQLKFPRSYEINLLERKPIFTLKVVDSNVLALVDDEGYIVSIEEISNLPAVQVAGAIGDVGEKVSSEQFFALQLIDNLFTLYQVREGFIDGDKFSVNLNKSTKVIFPLTGDRDVLISTLSLVFRRFEAEDTKPAEIDLRYKNPVIRE